MTAEQQRHDINDKAWEKIRPHTIGEKRDTRRQRPGYSAIYQRCILDTAYWSTLAGLAGDVWKLEKCTPPVLPVA